MQRERIVYAAVIVMLAVAGGALFVGYREVRDQRERQDVTLQALRAERDAIGAQLKVQTEKVRSAETDLEAQRKAAAELRDAAARSSQAGTGARSALDAAQGELAGLRRAEEASRAKLAALEAENQSLKKSLAEAQAKASASVAASADLSRELKSAAQGLEEAKARSAQLNRSYEALLKEKDRLSAADAARREELERTRKAFEEAQAEVARLTGARGIYTVQRADSLSTVAAFFYRDGNRWPDIFKANAFLIERPDLIYPGQVLIVPR